MNDAAQAVEPSQARRLEFEDGNGHSSASMIEVAQTRAAQEVQAAMVVAKKYPRNEQESWDRIMRACRRKTLAEQALYAYPKGNQTVTGPSIRMAEAMAQAWGNIDFGIIELEQRKGESVVMSYAWDLETNTRQTKIFTVKHERFTRKGSYSLADPREIYELTANQGARRLRACILGVIPGDVVDAAIDECEKTLKGKNAEPLADRIRKMVKAFGEIAITQEMIERRLNHKIEVTGETELLGLRKIYQSIRDNMAAREDFFELKPSLVERLNADAQHAPVDDGSQLPASEQKPQISQEEFDRLAREKAEDNKKADSGQDPSAAEQHEIQCSELAASLGIPEAQYQSGFKRFLLAKRKKDKPGLLSEAEWDELESAIKGKAGYFAV